MTEQLLRDYVQTGSESAFRELVDRYINLVYSTAYRRLGGDAHLAQDTVQTVFSDLARKASTLPADVMLGGWLHRHTCFVTGAMLRTNRRREAREKEAMEIFTASGSDDWKNIAPVLDEVVNELAPADRDAVILRFFEGLDFRTIGARIGSNEDAAQKRVSRAVEKLRTLLEQRGATLSVTGLASVLASESMLAVPADLATRVAGKALAHAAAPVGLIATLLALFTPAKIALVAAIAVALLGTFAWKQSSSSPKHASPVPNTGTVQVASATGDNLAATVSTREATATSPQTNVLRLTILAADSGKPVPNVLVERIIRTDTSYKRETLTARRDGTCDVPLPPPDGTRLALVTQMDDFASTALRWNPSRGEVIPHAYTLRLERPVIIGGRVLGPDGQPVEDAQVLIGYQEELSPTKGPESHEFGGIEVRTDKDGRWEIRRIAASMMRRLTGMARHSNYVRSPFIFLDRMSETEDQLRKGTHVFTLSAATVVRGTVVDLQGHPISGAEVVVGRRDSDARMQKTGVDGVFAIAGCTPGKILLTAEAKGYACTTIEVEAANDAAPFQFTLPPGKTLRVRVTDRTGAPIKNASIGFSDEYDLRTGERKAQPVRPAARPKTDENGLAVWDSAPDVPLLLEVSAPNYMEATGIKARPDGTEHVVLLQNSVTVSGTVRDAESGELLPRFRITCGSPRYAWDREAEFKGSSMSEHLLTFSGGTFRHTFREPMVHGTTNGGYMLRIEAEGYASAVTRIIFPHEREAKFDVKLRRSAVNWITVLLPDGRPAADTDVALVSLTASLRLTTNGFVRHWPYQHDASALTVTDAKGRCSWTASAQLLQIIFAHPLGFAEARPAELSEQQTIRLQPWGRLEGVITSNGKPVVAQELRLNLANRDSRGIMLNQDSYRATTDHEGRFRFEKVPPTQLSVQRVEKSQQDGGSSYLAWETVTVGPGETKTVSVHARDRTFALQPRWPDNLNPDPNWKFDLILRKPAPGALPGFLIHAAITPTYFLHSIGGGSYEAKDVPPGEYRVDARVTSQTAFEAVGIGSVTVPDVESGVIQIEDIEFTRPVQPGN